MKYKINQEYLRTRTPDAAWLAGFTAGDGCVYERKKRLSFGMGSLGRPLLERVKALLEAEAPIYDYSRIDKRNGRVYHECQLHFYGVPILLDDLHAMYNITPRKSLTLEPPNVELSTEEAFAFFVGYCDANGCVAWHYGTPRLSISSGSEQFLNYINGLVEIFAPHSEGLTRPVMPMKGRQAYQLAISGSQARDLIAKVITEAPYVFPAKWLREGIPEACGIDQSMV